MNSYRTFLLPATLGLAVTSMGQSSPAKLAALPMSPRAEIARSTHLSHAKPTKILHLAVSLPFGNAEGMQAFADAVSNPASPQYRHFISPEEVGRRFGVTQANLTKVTNYLKAQGFKINLVSKNRLSILADATVAQAETAFHTRIDQFSYFTTGPKGRTANVSRFAYTKIPAVPAELGSLVANIGGLENFTRPKPHDQNTIPDQIRTLYGSAPLYKAAVQGQGRTIAISSWDGFDLANVPHEYSRWSLPTPKGGVGSNISVVTISGGSQTGPEYGEADLDIQSILAVAPLCNLVIYDGGNLPDGSADMIGVLTKESDDNKADFITESYGWNLDLPTGLAAHNLHLSMTAEGITYLGASGDNGTVISDYPYPDQDPEVLMVGGTTISTDTLGNRLSETAWSGSGSGWLVSNDTFNILPSWQKGTGVPTKPPFRLLPDVAIDADPNTGYQVYAAAGVYGSTDGFYTIGGTSGASPTFAALLAVAAERLIDLGALTADGKGHRRFGRIQDLFYSYNGDPKVFYDVTVGDTGKLPDGTESVAGVGWDFTTGWGALDTGGFVSRFANLAGLSSVTIAPLTLEGGSSTKGAGTVTLSKAAPTGGAIVTLTSSLAAVTVPASITIPAGSTTANFDVSTSSVPAKKSVTISATFNGTTASGSFFVTAPRALGVGISPLTVGGGASAKGTVTISEIAPTGGYSVSLVADNTSAATVSPTVVVPAGQTTGTFTVLTNPVAVSTVVKISATAGGTTAAGIFTVAPVGLAGITLSKSISSDGLPVTATVTLTGPAPTAGITFKLSLSDPTLAMLSDTSLTISSGATSGTFTVTPNAVDVSKSVGVRAASTVIKSATLTIKPPIIASVTADQPSYVGGVGGPTITATLSGPAGPAGVKVALALSPSTAAATTATLIIPAGATSGSTTLSTKPQSVDTKVTVAATFNAVKRTTFVVKAASLASFTLNATTVQGGGSTIVTGTLTLDGPAGPGTHVIQLVSSTPSIIAIPSTVTIPAGANSATIRFTTKIVKYTAGVILIGRYGASSQFAFIDVTP